MGNIEIGIGLASLAITVLLAIGSGLGIWALFTLKLYINSSKDAVIKYFDDEIKKLFVVFETKELAKVHYDNFSQRIESIERHHRNNGRAQ